MLINLSTFLRPIQQSVIQIFILWFAYKKSYNNGSTARLLHLTLTESERNMAIHEQINK